MLQPNFSPDFRLLRALGTFLIGGLMIENDKRIFAETLAAAMEISDRKLSASALTLWWAVLRPFSLDDFKAALQEHITEARAGRSTLVPGEIIARIQLRDGRPGAEEAWSMVAHALGDEKQTLVLTEEMRGAFFVADALAGDKIAARMAFKEAYQIAIAAVRRSGQPVRWVTILGHDQRVREDAVMLAVTDGRLSKNTALTLTPHLDPPAPAVLKAITGGKK